MALIEEGHRLKASDDYDWNDAGLQVQNAPQEAVDYILKASMEGLDGRSQWVWLRLPNSDLVLAVFPQGETYFATEQWRTI